MLLPDIGLHGAYLRTALVDAVGRHQLANALRSGAVRPLWTGVVVEAPRLLDIRTRAAAALLALGPRAVLCGPTAASLHGCTATTSADVHVLLPYQCKPRSRPGLVVHHSCFYTEHVVELDGLRILALPHVVADLLCLAAPGDALAIADEVLRQAAPRSDELRAAVEQRLRSRPDPRGTVRGAGFLDLASPRAESAPESWVRMLLIERGFPLPEVNFSLRSPSGREVYRLDLAWPALRIALEYDGHAAHAGREEQDEARADDLRRRGWIVVRARADDLADPTRLLGELRAAFAARGYTW
jgi:very-short-patch-repair endonuclease